jgi:DNA-binding response OmpR family regulator
MNERDILRILIAEDEESFLKVLTTVLESTHRYAVYACESGEEAVEALNRTQYDVVILDHKMPGMTGLNVIQWMHEQKSSTPVIMLTGRGSENIAVEAMKLGAYDYIRKDNFDREHFPIIVNSVYERYLFKKERERDTNEAQERQKVLASLEALRTAVSSFARTADSSLARVDALMEKSEKLLETFLFPEAMKNLEHYFSQVHKEHDTIVTVTKSMVGLMKSIYEDYAGIQNAQLPAKDLSPEKESAQSKALPPR